LSIGVYAGVVSTTEKEALCVCLNVFASSTDGILIFASTSPNQSGDIFRAVDSTTLRLFSVDASGGLIANASSTFNANVNIAGALSASSTADILGVLTVRGTATSTFTGAGINIAGALDVDGAATSTFGGGLRVELGALRVADLAQRHTHPERWTHTR